MLVSALGDLHARWITARRVNVLASWFDQLAPKGARILDVGCGDGLLASVLLTRRPDLQIRGVDVLTREHTHIPVEIFDGTTLPFPGDSFDGVLFSDVLHHTSAAIQLLQEARRVSSRCVLIKDHYLKGWAAQRRLMAMDWVGNARFGVALPYLYWTEEQWQHNLREARLKPERIVTDLRLYPPVVDWVFGGRLHFAARFIKDDD
jgi:SAM-dependent methyltransferase